MVRTTTKNSIEEYGDPAKFLEDNQYLLGKQVFLGGPPQAALCNAKSASWSMAYNPNAHDIY